MLDKWLVEHGLSKVDLAQAGAFFDDVTNRLIIPVRSLSGAFCFDMIRNFDPKYPRYEFRPVNCRPSTILYGHQYIIGRPDKVVVVEGFSDVLALRKSGISSVSTMTSSISVVQKTLLSTIEATIVVWADGDEAGEKFIQSLNGVSGFIVEGYDPSEVVAKGIDPNLVLKTYEENPSTSYDISRWEV